MGLSGSTAFLCVVCNSISCVPNKLVESSDNLRLAIGLRQETPAFLQFVFADRHTTRRCHDLNWRPPVFYKFGELQTVHGAGHLVIGEDDVNVGSRFDSAGGRRYGPAPGIFRWRYLRGILSRFDGATTPRDFSPCGICLDLRNRFSHLMVTRAQFFSVTVP
jgi:hypothetical protein